VTVASQHQALEFFSKFYHLKITADSDVSQGLEINKLFSRGIKFRMSFLDQMTCSRKLFKGGPDKSFVTQEELCIVARYLLVLRGGLSGLLSMWTQGLSSFWITLQDWIGCY
jgi:hypothetical protein